MKKDMNRIENRKDLADYAEDPKSLPRYKQISIEIYHAIRKMGLEVPGDWDEDEVADDILEDIMGIMRKHTRGK